MTRRLTLRAVPLLALALAAATRVPASAHVPAALAGALAAPVAALTASWMVEPAAALWAGSLLAVSPIHTLASRASAPEALLVTSLLCALWLLAVLERHGHRAVAIAFGLVTGGLLSSGVAGFAAEAVLLTSWLALRKERQAAAGVSTIVALSVGAAASVLGLARSPLDLGEVPPSIPATTLQGLVRCTGASFTRVIGLEYQLVASHARYLLPLTLIFVALMARGATRLAARPRGLLLAGAMLPFALGDALALGTGHVMPLQAQRLVAALPFAALLLAAGLGSLAGVRALAAGVLVAGSLVAFELLALAR